MSYTLSYFDGRGLAEPIRMIFAYGEQEYKDVRAPFASIPATIPKEIKDKCTWGQVPIMEFEGKKLCQSLAITRYFAKKFGLVGSNDFEAALCDEYVDTCKEYYYSYAPVVMEKDEAKQKTMIAEISKANDERYLKTLNQIIKDNGGQRLVGSKLTWADIYLAHAITNAETVIGIETQKNYPAIKSLIETVLDVPQIKEWVASRPKTKF